MRDGKKHRAGPREDEAGFTLLEMLVAMVIVAVGMLGMAGMMASVARAAVFSKQMTTAATLTNDKLEEAIAIATAGGNVQTFYGNLGQVCSPIGGYAGAVYFKNDASTGGAGLVAGTSSDWDYRRCLEIGNGPTTFGTTLLRVSVTVDWLWNGKTKSDGTPYSITQIRDVAP